MFPDVTIHSFEPVLSAYKQLLKNTSCLKNIYCYNKALSDKKKDSVIYLNKDTRASSLYLLAKSHLEAFPGKKHIHKTKITTETIDSFFSLKQLKKPVLLKTDTQGHDLEILKGATKTLKMIDYIIIETSFSQLYLQEPLFPEIMHYLESKGFIFVMPLSMLKHPSKGCFLQMDALFVSKDIYNKHFSNQVDK
jgi:FkbM family methyltransferase